jgi:hypothetical protein
MGRYYHGDIDGKFWFAIQSSNAADRFGVSGTEPQEIEYSFYEENLIDVNVEIEKIEQELGENKEILDNFFEKAIGYNGDDMQKLNISDKELENYADLYLGYKIRDCINETGQCCFTAEY